MIRHIKRNILKKKLGKNDISREWRVLQIKKFQKKYGSKIGYNAYWEMRRQKQKKRKPHSKGRR